MSMESIVAAAVESAKDAGTLTETPSVDVAPEETADDASGVESAADGSDSVPASESAGAVETVTAVTERKWPEGFSEEQIAVLRELGYNAPVKDNRMPYSKSLKGIADGVLKFRTKQAEDAKKRDDEFKPIRGDAESFKSLQQKVNADPAGFMQWLVSMRPDLYSRYVTGATDTKAPATADKTETQKARETDPEPQPDVKYDDGSRGYTAEQHQKHNEWLIREGRRQASEEFEKRLKPIEQERAQARSHTQNANKVKADEAARHKRWGALYADATNRDKIAAALKADWDNAPVYGHTKEGAPLKRLTPVDDVIFDVLMPIKEAAWAAEKEKLSTDRNKVRADVLDEMKQAPSAASSRRTVSASNGVEDVGERTTEDIVTAAVRKAGLIK